MQLRAGTKHLKAKQHHHGKLSNIGAVARTKQRQQRCVTAQYKVVDSEGPLLPSFQELLETTPTTEAPPPPAVEATPPPPVEAAAPPPPPPAVETAAPPPPPAAAAQAPAPVVEAAAPPAPPSAPAPPSLEVLQTPQAEPSGISLPAVDTSSASDALNSLAADTSQQAAELQAALSSSLAGFTGAASGLGDELGQGLSSATSNVSQAFEDASGAASTALSSALGAASDTTRGFTNAVDNTTKAAFDAIDQAAAQAQALADQLLAAAEAQKEGVTGAVDQAAAEVASATGAYVQSVEQSLVVYRDQVWDSLPPEAQGVLVQVGDVAGQGAAFVVANPTEASVLGGLIIGPVAYVSYNNRYGGYSGELMPEDVLELLVTENSNALLVDVRSDELRAKDGVPELKFDARFKAVAVPVRCAQAQVESMSNSTLRQVASKERLVEDVHAAFISNLTKVETQLCKVVIMDQTGSDKARNLARALRREGLYNAYIMKGGFSKWAKDGLPVEATNVDYEAGQMDVLNDNLEVIAARAANLATRLRDPKVAIPVGGTTVALSVALYNYHTTLEVIGLLGLCASLYKKLDEYESPQAAAIDAAGSLLQLAAMLRGVSASPKRPATAAAGSAPTQRASRMQAFKPVPPPPPPALEGDEAVLQPQPQPQPAAAAAATSTPLAPRAEAEGAPAAAPASSTSQQ